MTPRGGLKGDAVALTVLVVMVAGCAQQADNGDASAAACVARTDSLAKGTRAADLAGTYRITLVATRGDSAGGETQGTLRLIANDSAHAGVPGRDGSVTSPLYGSTSLLMGVVGGVGTGALDADDPDAPGVLVFEWASVPEIMMRLGQRANRRDGRMQFDGASSVLRVSWVEGGSFGGSWRSGAMGATTAGGHFCAAPSP
jgi:hypothetical protein